MPEVHRNDDEQRYELREADEVVGTAVFDDRGPRRVFLHTEVDDGLQGKGAGSTLVRGALDDTREQGRLVVPECPYVARWIERHDDYADLLDPDDVGLDS